MPLNIPAQLVAGDTAAWRDTLADYPASAGWVLHYRLTGMDSAGGVIAIDCTASGAEHVAAVAAAGTATWVPGAYSWAAWVTKDAEVITVGTGSTRVLPDPRTAAAGNDTRSPARQALDEADAMLRTYGAKAYLQSITVGDRAKTFRSPAEFLAYRSHLQAEVAREQHAARLAAGLPSRNSIYVRFGARR